METFPVETCPILPYLVNKMSFLPTYGKNGQVSLGMGKFPPDLEDTKYMYFHAK